MRERDNNPGGRERGFSIIEILIVVAMIGVVTTFAILQIAGAQRAMRLNNSAREFMAWLDKARLDSLRRHPMSVAEMARVEITSATSYVVTIDQNGDGALDPPLTINIPASHNTTFAGLSVPLVIRFNWRGRPVNSAGNALSLAFTMQSTTGGLSPVPINLTSAGDASLSPNVNAGAVTLMGGSGGSANVRTSTQIP